MKQKGLRIPGIGHRIKSRDNLDKRVVIMKEYASVHFPSRRHLEFALEVEKITVSKGFFFFFFFFYFLFLFFYFLLLLFYLFLSGTVLFIKLISKKSSCQFGVER